MIEEIKKGLLTGLGAVLLTREKAEDATRKLVKEAKLSKEDAKELVDDLLAAGTRQWSEMEASVSKALRKGFDNLDIAGKKELHGLKSKVGKLEKRLKKVEEQLADKGES